MALSKADRDEIEAFARWQKEFPIVMEDHPPLRDDLKGLFALMHQLGNEVKSLADKLDQTVFQLGVTGEIPGGPPSISPVNPPRTPWKRGKDGRLILKGGGGG